MKNDWHDDPDRAAIEHIITPLRAPLQLDETFEVRVMSAVHAEALARVDAAHTEKQSAAENDAWWRRTYNVPVSLSGMALAASILGLVFIGATVLSRLVTDGSRQSATIGTSSQTQTTSTATQPAGAVQNVQFILAARSAEQVWLVGDFNGWTKKQTPLARTAGRVWSVSVPLPHGRHEYAFIVHDEKGERWIADPARTRVRDEFGTESSVLHVGANEGEAETNGS